MERSGRTGFDGQKKLIPKNLSDWNIEIIKDLVSKGVFESDYFDFKETLPSSKDLEKKERLVKSCSAFANSSGGFLIFGVKDDNKNFPLSKE